MPRKPKRRSLKYREQEQQYEPRVEIAIQALSHALVGSQMLVRFLLAQEGPDWADLKLLDAVYNDLDQAQFWLRKEINRKVKPPGKRIRHQ